MGENELDGALRRMEAEIQKMEENFEKVCSQLVDRVHRIIVRKPTVIFNKFI
jgi:hypothetical protein